MDRTAEPVASLHDPGLLAAYVEGRLDDDERRVMTAHLASCADCRQALAMLARAAGVQPQAARRRLAVASPIWLGLAATVILATLAVRRTDAPVPASNAGQPTPAVGASPGTMGPAPRPAEPSPRVTVPAADPLSDPGLLVKRSAEQRRVGGKTFRLTAGQWVDMTFDSTALLPTTQVQGAAERAALVQRVPALAPFAALGDHVVVVVDGMVYRFAP